MIFNMVTRRQTILGFGVLVGGGGAITATGAFDQVDADREVTVEFADDSEAVLAMAAGPGYGSDNDDNDYISVEEGDDGEISILIENVNRNAKVTYDNLVEFSNNGTQEISSITFEMIADDDNDGELNVTGDLSDISLGTGDSDVGLGLEIETRERETGQELPNDTNEITLNGTISVTATV